MLCWRHGGQTQLGPGVAQAPPPAACDSAPLCLTVKPDTLTDLTNQMTEKVGLVHGLPYVADRQGFAATLEQVRSQGQRSGPSGGAPALTAALLCAGVLRDVSPPLLHLGQRDGDQVRDGNVMSDAEGRSGPGGGAGGLRPVHRRGLLHGQSHCRQVSINVLAVACYRALVSFNTSALASKHSDSSISIRMLRLACLH